MGAVKAALPETELLAEVELGYVDIREGMVKVLDLLYAQVSRLPAVPDEMESRLQDLEDLANYEACALEGGEYYLPAFSPTSAPLFSEQLEEYFDAAATCEGVVAEWEGRLIAHGVLAGAEGDVYTIRRVK